MDFLHSQAGGAVNEFDETGKLIMLEQFGFRFNDPARWNGQPQFIHQNNELGLALNSAKDVKGGDRQTNVHLKELAELGK